MATRKEMRRALERYESATNWQVAFRDHVREVQNFVVSAPFADAKVGKVGERRHMTMLGISAGSLVASFDGGPELTVLELEALDDQDQANWVYNLTPELYDEMIRQLRGMR